MTLSSLSSWAAYALAQRRPVLGVLAGCAAVLAWFSKASAAFFVLVLVFDSLTTLLLSRGLRCLRRLAVGPPSEASVRAALWTLAGLAAAAAIVGLAFVLPHWSRGPLLQLADDGDEKAVVRRSPP